MSNRYHIKLVSWDQDADQLRSVREQVFIKEQHVPVALEWDDWDARSIHALALSGRGQAIGTGRLLPDGHIGRMAVLPAWRGRGVGSALFHALMDEARRLGYPTIELDAQSQVVGFYRRFGFVECSEEFMDAGIPHRKMKFHL